MSEVSFHDLYRDAKELPEYWLERTVVDLTDELTDAMEREGISRSELARRLGTSQAYVTKLLSGNANFTLMTLTKLAMAVGSELRLHFGPRGTRTQWFDVYANAWAAGSECCIQPASAAAVMTVSNAPVTWAVTTAATSIYFSTSELASGMYPPFVTSEWSVNPTKEVERDDELPTPAAA